MVLVQINLPNELDKEISRYQIDEDIKHKPEAIIKILNKWRNKK